MQPAYLTPQIAGDARHYIIRHPLRQASTTNRVDHPIESEGAVQTIITTNLSIWAIRAKTRILDNTTVLLEDIQSAMLRILANNGLPLGKISKKRIHID
jgi:hypothetical protein